MNQLEIAAVQGIRQTGEGLDPLTLRQIEPQALASRVEAAAIQQLDALKDGARVDVLKDAEAVERLRDAVVDQVLVESLDPTRRVTAGGLDETSASALADVTQTRAGEEAMRQQRSAEAIAEITRQATDVLRSCREAVDTFDRQLDGRQAVIGELGPDLGAEMIRSLASEQPLAEQWRLAQADLGAADLPAAQRSAMKALDYPPGRTVQDLINEMGQVGGLLEKLNAAQRADFTVERDRQVTRLEITEKELALDARLAMVLVQREAALQAEAAARPAPRVHEFPDLPADGSHVWFNENGCAWKTREGAIAHVVKLGDPIDRQGLESGIPRGKEVGIADQQRAHVVGPGFGVESPYGLALAHETINQALQNRMVEETIRGLQANHAEEFDFYLVSEMTYRPSQRDNSEGLCLATVNYEVFARPRQEEAAPLRDWTGAVRLLGRDRAHRAARQAARARVPRGPRRPGRRRPDRGQRVPAQRTLAVRRTSWQARRTRSCSTVPSGAQCSSSRISPAPPFPRSSRSSRSRPGRRPRRARLRSTCSDGGAASRAPSSASASRARRSRWTAPPSTRRCAARARWRAIA
jgi:hypothetical protein